jgi:hypothetical protein
METIRAAAAQNLGPAMTTTAKSMLPSAVGSRRSRDSPHSWPAKLDEALDMIQISETLA